jgi:hypothetical protein
MTGADLLAVSGPIERRDTRFRRNADRLHRCGPRVLAELFVELGASRMLRTAIEAIVGCYAKLDLAMHDAAGSRWWPQ